MNTGKNFCVLFVTFCFHFQVLLAFNNYFAAVVEYAPVSEGDSRTRLNENVKNYEELIKSAAKMKADIIVFPESGLTRDIWSKVPDPQHSVVPCNSTDFEDSVLKNLSCAAKANRIYVVLNLPEKRRGKNSNGDEVEFKYNTNVAFDRNGTVVARYAKYHLFDEPADKPEKLELSFFKTDFGVTFGTFICFDILFEEPASQLINVFGIRNFIFTTQWFSELPFLSALQVQRGWSEMYDVNLLASGYNDPKKGSSGSGIFSGKFGSLAHYMGNERESKLLFFGVPTMENVSFPRTEKAHFDGEFTAESVRDHALVMIPEKEELKFLSDEIELFNSKVIDFGVDEEFDVCSHNNFCCQFNVRLDKLESTNANYNYRGVALEGVRKFGSKATGGVQICAVVFCHGPEISSCTERASDFPGTLQVRKLQIKGVFNLKNAFQFPSTLIDDGDGNLDTLLSNDYEFEAKEKEGKKMISMSLDFPVDNLLTFGIWGRDFTKDGTKPSLPVSNASYLPISLPVLSIAFVIGLFFRG